MFMKLGGGAAFDLVATTESAIPVLISVTASGPDPLFDDQAALSVPAGAPEAASWAMPIQSLAGVGAVMRRGRPRTHAT
jgi:hypothetical protein